MSKMQRREQGFALPAAVGALVIVGVLVTAGFYIARQEVRIGVSSQNASLAFYLAETGANDVVENWNAGTMLNQTLWSDTSFVDTLDLGTWEVDVTRMATRLYFLDATGTVTEGGALQSGATRRAGLLVRLFSGEIEPPGALTTRGPTYLKGNAEVHGEDVYPTGWMGMCTNSLTDKPGIVAQDTADISWDSGTEQVVECVTEGQGKNKTVTCDTVYTGAGNITGTPEVLEDSAMTDTTFTQFGEMDWDELVGMADKVVTSLGTNINGTEPDSSALGACNTATLDNWGNPENPLAACGDYFPIIYHGGPSLRIQSSGVGQGILLVDGDLDLRGGFVFYGVVIVQGNFETQGSGNRIVGGVMASNAELEEQSLVGGSQVQYSTCGIEQAILRNSSLTRARPLAMRSFVDLSNLIN